jgi:hypothetical protein
MGKEKKRQKRTHCSGYPYFPVRVHPQHTGTPYTLRDEDAQCLLGLFCDPSHPLYQGVEGLEVYKRQPDLKRLGFLRSYSGYYWNKGYHIASSVYNTGRAYAPGLLNGSLRVVEDKVSELGTPLLSAVQDRSDKVLRTIDGKVDNVLVAAHDFLWPAPALVSNMVEKQRAVHETKVAHCNAARYAYLHKIEETIEFLKARGISGTAKYAAVTVMGQVEEAQCIPPTLEREAEVLVNKVGEAWLKLASLPPVSKLVETAQPSVEYARAKYLEAHDAIVASSAYSRALETACGIVHRVQDTMVYRAAANKLYPVISPYADPALDKITHSQLYSAVVDHLKPCAAASLPKAEQPPKWATCAQC